MLIKTPTGYTTSLNATLSSSSLVLPIPQVDMTALITAVGDGYTYLTIRDQTSVEIVKVTGVGAGVTIERAQEGTTAKNFPKGSCVSFVLTAGIVRDIVCSTECCVDDCCTPVAVAGGIISGGTVGVPYTTTVVFEGSTPIHIGVSGVPTWMTYDIGSNYVVLHGTPMQSTDTIVTVAATNCNSRIASISGRVLIQ